MKYENDISSAVIKRLPRYYRYLSNLKRMGISRISSHDLGKKMGVTPSQIRQDFFNFGEFGLQGYGYEVDSLYEGIGKILGRNKSSKMIIIGAGHLGKAIANHTNFEDSGFIIEGIFDANNHIVGERIKKIKIMHIDEMADFVNNNPVDIAVVAVPYTEARDMVDKVVALGIKGIWNFAPVEIAVPEDVVIENIHLSDSLMVLGYNLNRRMKE